MSDDPTDPTDPGAEAPAGNGRFDAHGMLAKFRWAMYSDPGEVREHNEDFAGVYAPTTPDDSWDRGPLFVVADGLGGHAAGEVASRLAVEAALSSWTAASPGPPQQALRSALRSANVAVFDAALETGRRGMGTTVVALTLAGREAVVGHVGDSRAYVVRADRCTQLTTDHSRVAEMVRMRLISPEMAASHPGRSMLTRSLGADPMVQIDLARHPIETGDVLVLCSDGLWDVVNRAELVEAAAALGTDAMPTPPAAARHLIDLALKRGAPDNATVVLVQVTSAQPIPAAGGKRSLFRRRG
jgi:serine/threonine protein phosphatase PrpC